MPASRNVICILLLWAALLASPSVAFAQACASADLTLVNVDGSARPASPPPYRLGDPFAVRLTGACATELNAALTKQALDDSVTLYLNRIPMKGLQVQPHASASASETLLVFELARDANDQVNRSAWDAFLGSQDKADFPVVAGLGVAGAPVVALTPSPITFGVAAHATILTTLAVGLIFVFGAFLLIATKSGALLDDHGFFSLGRSQMAFWGLLVFAAICGLWFLTWTLEPIPDPILSLLGISALTGLGSVAIESSKKADRLSALQAEREKLERLQDTEAEEFAELRGTARLAEIETETAQIRGRSGRTRAKDRPGRRRGLRHFFPDILNDGNGLSIHRLQAAVWTLFLGWVFVRSVATMMSLPSFDNSLLILMGISSGTYLGFKFPERPSAQLATDPATEKTRPLA